MEAHDLIHGCTAKSHRVFIAQIRLHHERQFGDILERYDIAGLYPFFIAAPAEERDTLVFIGDDFLEFFELQLSPWDYAAGALLVREAGGIITTIDGGEITLDKPCSILARNM